MIFSQVCNSNTYHDVLALPNQVVMKKIFFIGMAVAIGACTDTSPINPPEPKVIYKNLNDVRAGYNQPFSLDINDDGIGEYLFTVSLIGTAQGVETHFKVYPTRGNRLFASDGVPVMIPEGNNIEGQSFTKWVESMVIKTSIGENTEWSGDWKNAKHLFAGIQFQLEDNPYRYGWLRLSFDQAGEQFVIHDLAFENAPGKPIKAGAIQ